MEEIIDGIDPEAARLAFEALLPLLDAQTELRSLSTDIRRAIIHAAAIGRLVQQPEMKAEFAQLPAHRFDMQHVERLEPAALATWYAALSLQSATMLSSGAKLPDGIPVEGSELKQRMFKVLAYMLGDRSDVSTQLDGIRSGKGHIDLADDLMHLATLYDAHATALAADRTHYRTDDAVNAKKIAHAIYQVLGDGRASDVRYWSDYQARSWTLLVTTYDEVSAAGCWLYRHENGQARFPSLYAVGRQRRARRDDLGEGDDSGELPGEGDIGVPGLPDL